MAFSELGKLLELIERVVVAIGRRDKLPGGMEKSDVGDLKDEIFQMKQREEYK